MPSFTSLVDQMAADPDDSAIDRVVRQSAESGVSDAEIAHLAVRLAQSGSILEAGTYGARADIASTGGPSSLSTLVCPLFLRAAGYTVPKLGVPGRPAGGVDALAQVPGYRIDLSTDEVRDVLVKAGYAHFLALTHFAPLDGRMFARRKDAGLIAIPALVIASIMAKKIAVGVQHAGLDVRVAPHGSFGSTWDEARGNAQRFCRCARILGMRAVCFLTDGSMPYQPFIGRGESLLALLLIMDGRASPHIEAHVDECDSMARGLTPVASYSPVERRELRHHFELNLSAQGATFEAFRRYSLHVQDAHDTVIRAPDDGYLDVDMGLLRDAIVKRQRFLATDSIPFPDPCGVIMQKSAGEYVRKGEPVATVRTSSGERTTFAAEVITAFRGTSEPRSRRPMEDIADA